MALPKAIQFRHLVAQLTETERAQFLSTITKSHGNLIFSALFQQFARPHEIDHATRFNESLSNIIQSRKDKPKPKPKPKPIAPVAPIHIKLHEFPRTIIGYIASFLYQWSYTRFSTSSRHIYLGCNCPNVLSTLALEFAKSYSCIPLTSFPSVKFLSICPSKIVASQPNFSSDSPNFNHVDHLSLYANKTNGWVHPFIRRNIVNCDTITSLSLHDFRSLSDDGDMEKSEFLGFLTRFTNLKDLMFVNSTFPDDLTAQDISDACPDLDGLALDGRDMNFNDDLIRMLASELTFLSYKQYQPNQFNFDTVSFDKLEELRAFTPDNASFNCILKSASNLKKIFIKHLPNSLMTTAAIKENTANLIAQCPSLHYIMIKLGSDQLVITLDGIGSGLFEVIRTSPKTQSVPLGIVQFHVSSKCCCVEYWEDCKLVGNLCDKRFYVYLAFAQM
eukprot:532210_1